MLSLAGGLAFGVATLVNDGRAHAERHVVGAGFWLRFAVGARERERGGRAECVKVGRRWAYLCLRW